MKDEVKAKLAAASGGSVSLDGKLGDYYV